MTSAHNPPPMQTTEPTEPAINSGLLMGFSSVILGGITVLGLPLSDTTKFYVVLGLSFLGPLLSALRTRGLVFSPATWERAQADAKLVLEDLLQAESQIAAHGSNMQALQTVVVDALRAVAPVPASAQDTTSQTTATPAVQASPVPIPQPQAPWTSFPPVQQPNMAMSVTPPQYQDPAVTQVWNG